MNKYIVNFEESGKGESPFRGHTMTLEGDELLEFVKTAIIRNKDIASFSVRRADLEPARVQVIEAAFIRIFNL